MSAKCHTCVYFKCKNTRKNSPNLHFFKFPINPERAKVWVKYVGNSDLLLMSPTKLKNKMVCQKHFADVSFSNIKRERLIKSAVPINFKETNSERELEFCVKKSTKPIQYFGPSSSKR